MGVEEWAQAGTPHLGVGASVSGVDRGLGRSRRRR